MISAPKLRAGKVQPSTRAHRVDPFMRMVFRTTLTGNNSSDSCRNNG